MATIYLSLSTKVDVTQKQEILIRFSHGRINQRAKTSLFIPVEYWDDKAQEIIIPNFRLMNDGQKELKQYLNDQCKKLNVLISSIQTIFNESDKSSISPDWLKDCIERCYQRGKYAPIAKETEYIHSFFDAFDEF